MPSIGSMDRRIVVETPSFAQDTHGEKIATWSTLATIWARKDDRSATEAFNRSHPSAEVETVFVVRYRADVTPNMRISYGGIYYDITGVTEGPGRKEWTYLGCKARAS